MRHIFSNLAFNSIKKNKAIYIPYIIAIMTMYVITFVISALSGDEYISEYVRGGVQLQMIMTIGIFVMINVAWIFVFSTNRFVDKKRKKELGVYSILGMETKHILRIALIENLIVYAIAIVAGTFIGIVLEKTCQLIILKSLGIAADFSWNIKLFYVAAVLVLFTIIFIINQIDSTIALLRSNPLDYLKEESKGEAQPKSKLFLAIIGTLLLAGGYFLSFTTKNSGNALTFFGIAVILVIFGTDLLFKAGSITFLNSLKRNKKYYYKTNHFISVSGMLYRMKRNASELASICIFSTMFLVTMTSGIALYTTMNKTIDSWYRKDFFFSYRASSLYENPNLPMINTEEESEALTKIFNELNEYSLEYDVQFENIVVNHICNSFSEISTLDSSANVNSVDRYDASFYNIYYLTVADYNKANATDLVLNPDEVAFFSEDFKLNSNSSGMTFGSDMDLKYKIITIDIFPDINLGASITVSNGTGFIIFPDNESIIKALSSMSAESGINYYNDITISCDTNSPRSNQIALSSAYEENFYSGNTLGICTCKLATSEEVIGIYSGIFFVGTFLSIAFAIVTVLVLYFKQLFEGYEDAANFAIMRKVGLTKKEIRKSINSQVLIVFFLPVVVAIIHSIAAFPMLRKLLAPFGVISTGNFLGILALVVLFFSVIYTIAYISTGKVYSKLVNGAYAAKSRT